MKNYENFDDNEEFYEANIEELEEIEEIQEHSLYDEPKKPSFFQKFISFVTGEDYKKKVDENKSMNSIFDEFVNSVSPKSENFVVVREASELSEECLRLFKQKIIILNRSKIANEKLEEMSIFTQLSQVDIDYLKMILNRYVALVREKNVVSAQVSSFDKNVCALLELESDAVENLPKIEDAEKMQRIFRTDLNHIEGEKEELLYEMDVLIKGRDFFKKFTYVFVFIAVIMATFLSFMGIFYEADIFMQLFILIITVMFISTFLVILRSKISKDMRRNIAFQKRAVTLLNKKNAVYAYYTNFLRFEYKKYMVKSSAELRENLRELSFYKQHLRRADSVRSVIRESEYEIDKFMRANNIKNTKISMLDFAETINIEDQRRYYEHVSMEKEKAEQTLKELDEKHELVFNKLLDLKENDKSEEQIVGKILKAYYEETNKLIRNYEN